MFSVQSLLNFIAMWFTVHDDVKLLGGNKIYSIVIKTRLFSFLFLMEVLASRWRLWL